MWEIRRKNEIDKNTWNYISFFAILRSRAVDHLWEAERCNRDLRITRTTWYFVSDKTNTFKYTLLGFNTDTTKLKLPYRRWYPVRTQFDVDDGVSTVGDLRKGGQREGLCIVTFKGLTKIAKNSANQRYIVFYDIHILSQTDSHDYHYLRQAVADTAIFFFNLHYTKMQCNLYHINRNLLQLFTMILWLEVY